MSETSPPAGTTFGVRLSAAVRRYGPLCVGIDPHPSVLADWRLDPDVSGLERCARTMVEAAAGEAACVKPQSAFFEAFGSAGIAVLERVLADCRDAGLLSLLDVKRGDIGSTMAAYAAAYLTDGSPLAGDAVTLSPYLGVGSLDGAVGTALGSGRGVFLLAATSNPEAGPLQRAQVGSADGASVAQTVVEAAAGHNASAAERGEWGSVGLVIGATIDASTLAALDLSVVNGPVLAPGVGAQGAGGDDLRRVFGSALGFVLPTSSRAIMAAGPESEDLRQAIRRTRRELGSEAGTD